MLGVFLSAILLILGCRYIHHSSTWNYDYINAQEKDFFIFLFETCSVIFIISLPFYIFKKTYIVKVPSKTWILLVPLLLAYIAERFLFGHYNFTSSTIAYDIKLIDYVAATIILILISQAITYYKCKNRKDLQVNKDFQIQPDAPISVKEFKDKLAGFAKNYFHKENAIYLLKRIHNSFDPDKAISITVEGEWGEGKTTFVNYIRFLSQAKRYSEIKWIDVEVFKSSSPEKIREIFFCALDEELKKHIYVGAAAKRYLRSLDKMSKYISLRIALGFLNKFIPLSFDGHDYFDIINKKILKSRKKFVFVIDDLDRLEREEIIEVFKIIRSTGNFGNCIFVFPVDVDIVKEIIENKGNYVEKFFQSKYSIPKVPKETYLITLQDHINQEKGVKVKLPEYLWNFFNHAPLNYRSVIILKNKVQDILDSNIDLFSPENLEPIFSQVQLTYENFYDSILILKYLEENYSIIYQFIKKRLPKLDNLHNSSISQTTKTIKDDPDFNKITSEVKSISQEILLSIFERLLINKDGIDIYLTDNFSKKKLIEKHFKKQYFNKISNSDSFLDLKKITNNIRPLHIIKALYKDLEYKEKLALIYSAISNQTNTVHIHILYSYLFQVKISCGLDSISSNSISFEKTIVNNMSNNFRSDYKTIRLLEPEKALNLLNYIGNPIQIIEAAINNLVSALYDLDEDNRNFIISNISGRSKFNIISKYQFVLDNGISIYTTDNKIAVIEGPYRLNVYDPTINLNNFIFFFKETDSYRRITQTIFKVISNTNTEYFITALVDDNRDVKEMDYYYCNSEAETYTNRTTDNIFRHFTDDFENQLYNYNKPI